MRLKAILVMTAALIAAAGAAHGQDDTIQAKVKIVPAVEVPGMWMQVENVAAGAQVKDELFAGTEKFAQGATSVTEINLDPNTMSMLGEDRGRDAELARKLNLMVVRSYMYPKPGMYNPDDLETFRKRLQSGNWSCPIHVRNEEDSSDICTRSGSDHETNELVVISAHPQKLVLVHIIGKMSLAELNEMSGSARGLMPRFIVVPHPVPEPHIHIKVPREAPQAPESSQPAEPPQSPQSPQPAAPPQ